MKNIFSYFQSALLLIFFLTLPWQTKLILVPSGDNYTEIALYASQIAGIALLIFHLIVILKDGATKRFSYTSIAGIILAVFSLVSVFFASDSRLGLSRYLILLLALALYLASSRLNNRSLSLAKKMFLFGLIPSAILGIWQFLSQSSFSCSWLGLALHDPSVLGTTIIEAGGRFLRAYGSFDHPNIFGGISVLAVLLAARIFLKEKQSIFLYLAIFFTFAVFVSFSRAALLALALGMILIVWEAWRAPLIQKKRSIALCFFVFLFLGILGGVFWPLVYSRTQLDNRLEAKSIVERTSLWQEGKSVAHDNVWTGVGIGNYIAYLKAKDTTPGAAWEYQPVHDTYLLVLAEVGLFGCLAFLGLLFFSLKDARRYGYASIVIPWLFLMAFDHWFWSLPFGLLFLFSFLAILREGEGTME